MTVSWSVILHNYPDMKLQVGNVVHLKNLYSPHLETHIKNAEQVMCSKGAGHCLQRFVYITGSLKLVHKSQTLETHQIQKISFKQTCLEKELKLKVFEWIPTNKSLSHIQCTSHKKTFSVRSSHPC